MKAILSLAVMLCASAAFGAETRPVVVELFTSQSCSSCPPADALLGELAKRANVVALGFHVTYWDGAAWRDPFARQASTDRQITYDKRLTGGQVYTPQMVIDGTEDVVGSDRGAIFAALDKLRPAAIAPVSFAADRKSITIGPVADGAATIPAGASVLLARYVLARTTHVAGGENASRTLTDSAAVESLATLGAWQGASTSFPIEPPGEGEGLAALVQAPDGRILGAAALPRT